MRRGVFEEVGEIVEAPLWKHELHELAQPLTRLQWRLEIGQRMGDEATLRETVEGSLADAQEITEWVRRMRAQMGRAQLGQAQTVGERSEVEGGL
jgi:hypothetical protein